MTKGRLFGLGIGVVLIVAALGLAVFQGAPLMNNAGAALAQAPSTPTPQAPQPSTGPAQQKQPLGNVTDIVNAFWNSLASKLGISADTLKSDVTAAQKDAIEQAVKDGRLTRAQADRIEQNLNANRPFGPFMFGGFGRGFRRGPNSGTTPAAPPRLGPRPFFGGFLGGTNQIEAVATALNMKPADLVAQLKSGKTLADLAQTQNVDQATVKQAIINTAKAQIQREVQDGILTQAQADSLTANLTPDKIDLTHTSGRWGWFK
jgi:hypothetical protein